MLQQLHGCFTSLTFKKILTLSVWMHILMQTAFAIDISDRPLETERQTGIPTVMFILDDSGSMDWEIITKDNNGLLSGKFYIFPKDPGDNLYSYDDFPAHYMTEGQRKVWKSQWFGYNRLFYNPNAVYTPWPNHTGPGNLPQANTGRPRSNPLEPSYTIKLNKAFFTVKVAGVRTAIHNAHYFIVNDTNKNGRAEAGEEVYLVDIRKGHRNCYLLNDSNQNEAVDDNELSRIPIENIPAFIRPEKSAPAELQSFANWYSFYRRRSLTAKSAVGRTISKVGEIQAGFYSINKKVVHPPLPINVTTYSGAVEDKTHELLSLLYPLMSGGGTYLREGLDAVGRYYMGTNPEIGTSPFLTRDLGGECQQTYAIVITDGYWTETDFPVSGSDADGDGSSNTLADMAMKYYTTDLRNDLENNVSPAPCDSARHQRMITFSVSFGSFGRENPNDFHPCTLTNEKGVGPIWENPFCGPCINKNDDLWHAAANTTGKLYNALEPEALIASLNSIFSKIDGLEKTGASAGLGATKIYSGTHMYQTSYNIENWTGDLKSYRISHDPESKHTAIIPSPTWSAAEKLERTPWDVRCIVTYNGIEGIPFRWDFLTPKQQADLNGDKYLLKYIRGLDKKQFRPRGSILGDMVHSSPLLIGKHIFVGANDGMLHVFKSATGEETFAYIPNLLLPNLKDLATPYYTHKFYVDQTPVHSKVVIEKKQKTYLVGGLGKGGKGYYCLDITDLDTKSNTSESGIAHMVQWEFSDPAHLGYTYSQPVIVKTKAKKHPYVVVFGNGYNSTGGFAELFIIDLLTGSLIKRINTGVGVDNGLSSPIATDVNNDRFVDYIYAGDLKGNLWKFNISGDTPSVWDIAFKNPGGNPAPLFKTAPNQPITTRPDVMRHCSSHGYMVVFGTGKYLGNSDLITKLPQAIYGIWDYGDDNDPGEYPGEFDPATFGVSNHPDTTGVEVRLLYQTNINHNPGAPPIRTTSMYHADWATIPDCHDTNPNQKNDCVRKNKSNPNPIKHIGWMLELPTPKERIHQDVHIRNNVLTALSKIPVETPCAGGGYSMFHALNPCRGSSMVTYVSPTRPDALSVPPVIIETPDSEIMIFDKEAPPAPAPEDGVKKGVYFWRETFQ